MPLQPRQLLTKWFRLSTRDQRPLSDTSSSSFNMDGLPTEVRHCILQFADLESLKALRLTSKVWVVPGQEYLISPEFLCQTYRDDFTRLLSVANHPAFSPLIKTIRFDQGELHDYHARHNMYGPFPSKLGHPFKKPLLIECNDRYFVQYMKEPVDRDRDSRETWQHYLNLKQARESFHINNCSLLLLTKSFGALPNLTHISISLNRCPFRIPLLRRIWRISSSRLLPRVTTTERFANILLAVASTSRLITTLTHDRLPFEFWDSNSRVLSQVIPAFSKLTDLRLCCDYSVFPNALHYVDSFTGLAACLAQAVQLRTLHLGFQASQLPTMEFEKYLGAMTWEHLHTLSLSGMKIMASEASDFIARHKQSLRYLEIGGLESLDHSIEIRLGSLKDLLTRMRDEMCLTKLNMRGMVHTGDAGNDTWLFGPGTYDEGWEADLVDGNENARRMEEFVLRGGEWPDGKEGPGPTDWRGLQDILPGDVIVGGD